MGSVLVVAGAAQEQGSIGGIVHLNGQGLPEHRIMLIRFGPADEVHRTPGQTDTAGQFTFENLDTGEGFEYFVGIRYEGQLYRSVPIRLREGQRRTGVILEVGTSAKQTTEEAGERPPLVVANHLVVLVLRDDHLEVREVVRILSSQAGLLPGTRTESSHAMDSFYLPLPQDYVNFAGIQGFTPEQVRLLPFGLHFVAPLAPGEHRLVYTYALPLHADLATIVSERTLPTTTLDVLVADERLVAASDLQFMGRVPIDPHTFWHFRGVNLAVQTRFWLQVTRRNTPAPFLPVGAYSIVVGLTLLGIGVPLYEAWRWWAQQGQKSIETAGEVVDLHVARLRLLQTIAHLDDQHQAGILESSVYQQRRSESKKRLLDLVQQLRHTPSDKETSGELL